MESLIRKFWCSRKATAKKGDSGRVLIVGGSQDYVGALALAGLAALRTGVDWVTVAAPEKVAWAVNSLSPDLVTKKFKGTHFTARHVEKALKISQGFDAILIGNGIGMKSKGFCQDFIKRAKRPLVLDADAIKSVKNVENCLLTPHAKEFELYSGKKLTGTLKKDIKIVQSAAGSNVILLKGHIDIIASKDKHYLNKTGNPGMTVAGTGDVLAGLCVGFAALGMDYINAARCATYINGKVGDLLAKKKGYALIASDIVADMHKVLK
jgi:NAD(P)H-hydrate epimerase